MNNKTFIFFIIVGFLIFSCKKPNTGPDMSITSFPMAVGDRWVYQVIDSTTLPPVTDTATIVVINKTISGDSIFYHTQSLMGSTVDSGNFVSVNNVFTFGYIDDLVSPFSQITLSFPLSPSFGSNTVNNYKVLDSVYNIGYVVNQFASGGDFYANSQTVVCPGVGVVYQTKVAEDIPFIKKSSVRLISYQLN